MRNGRCPVAETFDEPLVVVKSNEVGDLGPCLVEILEVEEPEAFFLHRPHEALGHTVALGLGDEGVREFDSEPSRLAFEDVRCVLSAPVQPQLQPGGDGTGIAAEVLGDAPLDGLERRETAWHHEIVGEEMIPATGADSSYLRPAMKIPVPARAATSSASPRKSSAGTGTAVEGAAGLTTSERGGDVLVLPRKLPEPEYRALTRCVPVVRVLVLNDAWPETSTGIEARTTTPSKKVTFPVGVPEPDVTVAVKVTLCPLLAGLTELGTLTRLQRTAVPVRLRSPLVPCPAELREPVTGRGLERPPPRRSERHRSRFRRHR